MKLRSLSAGFVGIVALSLPVSAADSYGSFTVSEEVPALAVMAGSITSQTPLDFRRMIAAEPQVAVVALSSDGGAVNPALLLADDIHFRGLSTYIPTDGGCYSACAFVFLAGEGRVADGKLGVHQFYGGEESVSSAQYAVSDILEILGKFDVPQPVITQMLRTPPGDMYVFPEGEIEQLKLDRISKPLRAIDKRWREASSEFEPIIEAQQDEERTAGRSGAGPTQPQATPDAGLAFALYDGVDFYGSDIAKIRTGDIVQCYAACLDTKQCMAITLNTDPRFQSGPNCFLKTDVGRTEFYENAISGQFRLQGQPSGIVVEGQFIPPVTVIPLE